MLNSCFKKERNMSVLVLVLAIVPQTDEPFPQSLDMGRPKLEKQTTSADRMKKWRQNLNNKELENKKRAKYHQNKATKLKEQLEKEREKARIRKALSREKQKELLNRQKLQGLKIKERNRKLKECSGENFSSQSLVIHTPLSTERVQKHRENKKLIVDINFKSSYERKSKYLSKKLRNAIPTVPPKVKQIPFLNW